MARRKEALTRMVEASTIDPATDLIQARARAEAGYWSEALALYRVILSTQPGNIEALLGAAQMLRRLKNYPEAEELLASACSDHPKDVLFRIERARLWDAQARYGEVFDLLTGLLSAGYDQPSVWCGILRSLRLQTSSANAAQRLHECTEWSRRARAAQPKDLRVLSECGLLQIALQRPRQGLALLLQAGADDLLVQTLADIPSLQAGAESSSILLLESAIDLLPEDAHTLRAAASSLISLSQDKAAADALAKLLALDPADQAGRQQRYECLRRAGLATQAKQVAEELVKIDASNPDYRLQLADTLTTLGHMEEACDLLESGDEAAALLNMNSDPGLDRLLDYAIPDSPTLLLALARRHAARYEFADAAWDYGRYLELSFPESDREVYRELLFLLREFAPQQSYPDQQPGGKGLARDQDCTEGCVSHGDTVEGSATPLASHNDAAREARGDPADPPASAVKSASYSARVQSADKESATAKGVDEGFSASSKRAQTKNAASNKTVKSA